eukprot:Pgem_evm1s10476
MCGIIASLEGAGFDHEKENERTLTETDLKNDTIDADLEKNGIEFVGTQDLLDQYDVSSEKKDI